MNPHSPRPADLEGCVIAFAIVWNAAFRVSIATACPNGPRNARAMNAAHRPFRGCRRFTWDQRVAMTWTEPLPETEGPQAAMVLARGSRDLFRESASRETWAQSAAEAGPTERSGASWELAADRKRRGCSVSTRVTTTSVKWVARRAGCIRLPARVLGLEVAEIHLAQRVGATTWPDPRARSEPTGAIRQDLGYRPRSASGYAQPNRTLQLL